jgi:hypothetical protein
MTLNPQNPQRGTGVRKAATGVRPAVPAPAPAPAARPATGRVPAVAPAARPATGRVPAVAPAAEEAAPRAASGTARRPIGAAPGGASRPPLRSGGAAAAKQGGTGTQYLMLTIIILLLGMVAYVCIPIGGKPPLAVRVGRMWGILKKPTDKPAEDAPVVGLDAKYKAALAVRERAANFLADQEQKYKDQPQTLTDVDVHRVLGELEKYRAQVYLGVDDVAKVAEANGKDTTIDAATAKEEHKKQKAAANDLGKALVKWKGPKDQIFSASAEFVTQKFNPTPAPAPDKPAEKRDPKSLLTVVAPATPNDLPKPVEPPKEDPKPVEPKPEPEKPKPAEPKPEPEKPKPVEPKPEPEKPKEDPKPEPEKPKPVEPKPEPEKPKPAEPKPEPEKPKEEPKPEPKPEPEKPKEEPKPAKVEKKVDVVLADADKLVQDGYPLAKDVIGGSKNLPSDPEKLKTLAMKAETAQAFFVKARDTYTEVKDVAPESANVPASLAKIEKILALLQNASDAIKSKMK